MKFRKDKNVSTTEKIKPTGFWKKFAQRHWYAPDLPHGEPIFQPTIFAKWASIYIGLPIAGFTLALMLSAAGEQATKTKKPVRSASVKLDVTNSQIIDFRTHAQPGEFSAYVKRAPGTLIRVKLLNAVEGTGNAPVHAQILDNSLGKNLFGGTLLGDAASNASLGRVTITFNFARDPKRLNIAIPVQARALAKDGTLGLSGTKKEGMLARSVLGGASKLSQDAGSSVDSFDIRHIFMKALATGFLAEAGGEIEVEQNRAALLVLKPNTEFFAELIDYFPGANK